MWSIILEALALGFVLAVSLGPVFIALTQTSIEKGLLPGMTVGTGIWISDLIIITLFYLFVNEIKDNIESDTIRYWLGISGAIIMIGFGLYLIFKKPVLDFETVKHSYRSYIGFWLKGFLINTINPFTYFFWMGSISSYVIGRGVSHSEAMLFLGTIFLVIVLSDSFKVLLAHYLKQRLTPKHINAVGNLSGFILIGIGLFLAYDVF